VALHSLYCAALTHHTNFINQPQFYEVSELVRCLAYKQKSRYAPQSRYVTNLTS